jgi:hypothetical protein
MEVERLDGSALGERVRSLGEDLARDIEDAEEAALLLSAVASLIGYCREDPSMALARAAWCVERLRERLAHELEQRHRQAIAEAAGSAATEVGT